jgi:hypothetical protein
MHLFVDAYVQSNPYVWFITSSISKWGFISCMMLHDVVVIRSIDPKMDYALFLQRAKHILVHYICR